MLQGPLVCSWAGVGYSRGGTRRGMYSEGQKTGIHGTWHNPYPDDQGGCILPRKRRILYTRARRRPRPANAQMQSMIYVRVIVRSQWSAWRPTDNCSGFLAAAARGSNRRTTSSQQQSSSPDDISRNQISLRLRRLTRAHRNLSPRPHHRLAWSDLIHPPPKSVYKYGRSSPPSS